MANGNGGAGPGTFVVQGRRPITIALVVAFLLATLVFMEGSGGASIDGVPAGAESRLLAQVVPTPPLPPGPETEAEALALARRTADEAVATSQQAVVSGELEAVICEILLGARATVITTINALIAEFPLVATELALIRDVAVGIIDALLAELGCAVPSPG